MGRARPIYDVEELKRLPTQFVDTFRPANIIAKGYPRWDIKGDTSAFFALFFDNLAVQLILAGLATGTRGDGFELQFYFTHVMGGVGVSIFLGNLYYTLQASKVAMKSGKMDTCAQPYGINLLGGLVKTVWMLGIFHTYSGFPDFMPKEEAMTKAWNTACAANFIGGFSELLVAAIVAPFITKNVPTGALVAPLGAFGLSWLGCSPILGIIRPHITWNVTVGFIPLVILWMNFFGGVSFGKLPGTGVMVLVGVALAWSSMSLYDPMESSLRAESGAELVGFHGLKTGLSSDGFGFLLNRGGFGWLLEQEYKNMLLGVAATNCISTLACVLSAKKQGDVYSPMETMIVDGLGSMIGAFFGSPYCTSVRLGHVTYKQMGAKRGYSLLNGTLYLLFSLFGLQAFIAGLVPTEAFLGIIVVIGFSTATQCIESVPRRWIPCVLVGMVMGFPDLARSEWTARSEDLSFLTNGYFFISFLYTFALMMVTDRWFKAAAGVFIVLAFSSFIGLIHAASLGLPFGPLGTSLGRANEHQAHRDVVNDEGARVNQTNLPGAGTQFVLCYLGSALLCGWMWWQQQRGNLKEAEAEDFREIQASEQAPLDAKSDAAPPKPEATPAVAPSKPAEEPSKPAEEPSKPAEEPRKPATADSSSKAVEPTESQLFPKAEDHLEPMQRDRMSL